MSRYFSFFTCVLILCFGCKTISVTNKSQHVTTQKMGLGTVGLDENFIIQKGHTNTATPNYDKPIKLTYTVEPFSRKTFKVFLEAKKLQHPDIDKTNVDSLPEKPRFITLQLADRVGLIGALNSPTNSGIKDYLALNIDAKIITRVSVAFNKSDLDAINSSDELFLEKNGLKSYGLQVYKNGKPTKMINLNQGVVFAYRTSCFCWQENERHQLYIVDLVDNQSGCPNNTYRSAQRAKSKVDYFKF